MIDDRIAHLFPATDSIFYSWCRIALETKTEPHGMIWYTVHGKSYESTENFCKVLCMSDEDTVIWILKFGKYLPRYYRDGKLNGN
jgi:hypothetical protein